LTSGCPMTNQPTTTANNRQSPQNPPLGRRSQPHPLSMSTTHSMAHLPRLAGSRVRAEARGLLFVMSPSPLAHKPGAFQLQGPPDPAPWGWWGVGLGTPPPPHPTSPPPWARGMGLTWQGDTANTKGKLCQPWGCTLGHGLGALLLVRALALEWVPQPMVTPTPHPQLSPPKPPAPGLNPGIRAAQQLCHAVGHSHKQDGRCNLP